MTSPVDPVTPLGVTQTLLAGREDGVPGNCVQAAIATLLGEPIDAVPHFLLWLEWNHVMVEWLAEKGWRIYCRFTDTIPDERCIVAGVSPRGVAHVCVAENGRIVWDPHPSRDGLTKIDEAWFIEPIEESERDAALAKIQRMYALVWPQCPCIDPGDNPECPYHSGKPLTVDVADIRAILAGPEDRNNG